MNSDQFPVVKTNSFSSPGAGSVRNSYLQYIRIHKGNSQILVFQMMPHFGQFGKNLIHSSMFWAFTPAFQGSVRIVGLDIEIHRNRIYEANSMMNKQFIQFGAERADVLRLNLDDRTILEHNIADRTFNRNFRTSAFCAIVFLEFFMK